jgi:alpha-ribazole phosphatase
MTRIFLVRHGQSTANAGAVTMEHSAIPLSPMGVLQATALAAALDVAAGEIRSSAFVRARETARPFAAKLNSSVAVHPLLNEFSSLDERLIAGMTLDERRPITEAYWATADPDMRQGQRAETFREFYDRVSEFMLMMNSLPDSTVLFGHGIWFSLLIWRLMGFAAIDSDAMKAFRRFQTTLPMPNCAVYELSSANRGRWAVFYEATRPQLSDLQCAP